MSRRRKLRPLNPGCRIESLEERKLLSASYLPQAYLQPFKLQTKISALPSVHSSAPIQYPNVAAGKITNPLLHNTAIVTSIIPNDTSPNSNWLTPAQMTDAYGVSEIMFGSIQGTGAGQTIAIVDAYDDPNIASDLQQFDLEFGLPAPPSFQRLNEDGVAGDYPAPATEFGGNWGVEESLDVEWAHAIAPQASIDLVEASGGLTSELISTAANTARFLPGVSVVTMSFGGPEYGGESSEDTYFTTPTGHEGVTFVASTGDDGAPGDYPAYSPDVLAVGGTTLSYTNTYLGETGWSLSGGGISNSESQPDYQSNITVGDGERTIPDVSMDADPGSSAAVYDSLDYGSSPWIGVGGTSLAAPMWSALIAVANQGRQIAALPTLDGPNQTLPAIYALPASDFHDITSGGNGDGQFAGPGYDLVTGIGTPIANLLVPDLAGVGSISGNVFQDNNSDSINDGTDVNLPGTTIYLDTGNTGALVTPTTTTADGANLPHAIPDHNFAGERSIATISGTTAPITSISLTLDITHPSDSDLQAYLIAPNGTDVTLFENIPGAGANFTDTTFSATATSDIANASAPFTGTFAPGIGTLSEFDGLSGTEVNGNWTLKVADTVSGNTGTLNSWSLSITTADTTTTTDSNGNYIFNSVALGSYNIRQVVPAGEIQTGPGPGILPPAANVVAVNNSVTVTGEHFADFPDVFSTTAISANEYVTLDPTGTILQLFTSASPGPTPDYQVPLADIPSLTFNMLGVGDSLFVDYTNGNPIPAGNLTFTGASGNNDNLEIIGQSPTQNLSLTDTQVGPASGSQVLYSEVSTLSVLNCTANYTGNFNGFQTLFVGSTATLNWS